MARLALYRMPGRSSRGYIVDIQADLLSALSTRVVLPMLPLRSAPAPIRDLNPVVEIRGEPHVMLTQAIASIPARELKRTVGTLAGHHDETTRALDILFLGI